MKITLISPFPDITAFGIRTISAYLKEKGFDTQLIFLPDMHSDDIEFGKPRYDDSILDGLIPVCKDSDIIGVTIMTNFYDGAVQVTQKLKSGLPEIPVIWGGIHPTIRPEESLEFADMVCVGDGEDAALELMERLRDGKDISDTPNLWVKLPGGEIKKNPVRALKKDIDLYPMPDYSLVDHHIMDGGAIKPLTFDGQKEFLERGTVSDYLSKVGYQTMTGRGCPHMCTYCVNDTLKKMYNNQNYLRWRSTEHVIRELEWVKEKMPYVGFIWISDDAFFARPKANIEEFCREYKARIDLPFSCLASPQTLTEEKMDMLVDAGLIYVQMGVESGSARIQELFNRKQMNNERLMKAFKILNKHKDTMFPPSYDFILDVPYERESDKIESLRLIAEIPKPYQLQPFSLVLYPGTKLYDMAKSDNMIGDERREIYAKSYTMRKLNYLNLLMTMSKKGKFPSRLLKFLVSFPVVNILNSAPMRPVITLVYMLMRASYRTLQVILGKR